MQSRTIDGFQFHVSPLPAFQALEQLASLTSLLGPPLFGLLSSKSEDPTALSGALVASLRGLKGAELSVLVKGLLRTATVMSNGNHVAVLDVADVEFQGKLLTLLKAAAFAAEVNYADFFAAARGALGSLGEAAKRKMAGLASPNA